MYEKYFLINMFRTIFYSNVYNFLKEVPESAINSIKNLDSDTKQKDETTKPKINNKKRYRP